MVFFPSLIRLWITFSKCFEYSTFMSEKEISENMKMARDLVGSERWGCQVGKVGGKKKYMQMSSQNVLI